MKNSRLQAILTQGLFTLFIFWCVAGILETGKPVYVKITLAVLWIDTLLFGIGAFLANIEEIVKDRQSQRSAAVDYAFSSMLSTILVAFGCYATAWVLFMRLFAVRAFHSRIYQYKRSLVEEIKKTLAAKKVTS